MCLRPFPLNLKPCSKNSDKPVRWLLDKITILHSSAVIPISTDVIPYLCQFSQPFTQTRLINALLIVLLKGGLSLLKLPLITLCTLLLLLGALHTPNISILHFFPLGNTQICWNSNHPRVSLDCFREVSLILFTPLLFHLLVSTSAFMLTCCTLLFIPLSHNWDILSIIHTFHIYTLWHSKPTSDILVTLSATLS